MPSYSVRRSRIKEFKTVAGNHVTDAQAQKVLENNSWDVSASIADLFDNPWRYPEIKKKDGDQSKVQKIFEKYADKDEKDIMSEKGMMEFFKEVSVNPESYETLAVAWLLGSSELGILQKEEFVNGFTREGCNGMTDIKKVVKSKVSSLSSEAEFLKFYNWIFEHTKEDDKKKTIPSELAVNLWRITLSHKARELPLLDQWLKWIAESKDVVAVNKDVWEQAYPFLKETRDAKSYDDGAAWPVQMDEFIETISS